MRNPECLDRQQDAIAAEMLIRQRAPRAAVSAVVCLVAVALAFVRKE